MIDFVKKASFIPHWVALGASLFIVTSLSVLMWGIQNASTRRSDQNASTVVANDITCQVDKAFASGADIRVTVNCNQNGKVTSHTIEKGSLIIDILSKQAKAIKCSHLYSNGSLDDCKPLD